MRTKLVCTLRVGDRTETREFRGTHVRIGRSPVSDWVVPEASWRQLLLVHDPNRAEWEAIPIGSGVALDGREISFEEDTPLASSGSFTFEKATLLFEVCEDTDAPVSDAIAEWKGRSLGRARALAEWAKSDRRE